LIYQLSLAVFATSESTIGCWLTTGLSYESIDLAGNLFSILKLVSAYLLPLIKLACTMLLVLDFEKLS